MNSEMIVVYVNFNEVWYMCLHFCLDCIDWQAIAALGTWATCVFGLISTLYHHAIIVKVKAQFDGYKIFNDRFVNLIDISVINKSDNAIYIDGFGIKLLCDKCFPWYNEISDNENSPFYDRPLPLHVMPGQHIHLFINTECFCKAMSSESIDFKTKVKVYVTLSTGKTKTSAKSISIKDLSVYGLRTANDVHIMTKFDEKEDTNEDTN